MKKWKKVLIISSLCTLAGAFTVLAAPNYDNIAVSKVSGSVNIRTEANTTSAVTGKIQNDCAAEILETVDGEGGKWYKIRSGSVTGYIKAEYFVTGEAAAARAKEVYFQRPFLPDHSAHFHCNNTLWYFLRLSF